MKSLNQVSAKLSVNHSLVCSFNYTKDYKNKNSMSSMSWTGTGGTIGW